MAIEKVNILLVEDNKDFAKLLQVYLHRYEKDKFNIIWKENYSDAMNELFANESIDVVLMDYFLPGKNGFEISKEIIEKHIRVPIIFLTVNKDFDIVLKVMKLGIADYLVKEEISSPVLPKTILNVLEKAQLKQQLMQIEISKHRVAVMKDMLSTVLKDIEAPLHEMELIANDIHLKYPDELNKNYIKIIKDNVERILTKVEKLKGLKDDKTVPYIKDIRMIDLS
ncbi:MAG: response regulator [Bacteroidota bacterium]